MNDPLDDIIEAPQSASCSTIEHHPEAAAAGATRSDDVSFFGSREPAYTLQSEKAHHRAIILLAMQGKTNLEIAAEMECTAQSVSYVLKQPWALEYMSRNMHSAGMGKVEILLKGAASKAVERLITEMDNPTARSAERTTAADKVLDRLFGRATQPVLHRKEDLNNMTDAELAEIVARGRS
jgi:hypothetical protein